MGHDERWRISGSGVPVIDAEHQGLVFLLGRIFTPGVECRRAEHGCDHTDCCKIGALASFLGRNFAAEEAMMGQGAYPLDQAHCRDHGRLLGELREMQAAHICGERDHAVVRHSIERWIVRHYSGADFPLARWAITRRVSAGE